MLPLELALGEPQYGCQLLESPRTIVGRFVGEKTFCRLFVWNCLLGEMYVDISVNFVLELIRMAIASNSGISWCCVWEIELCTSSAVPPNALVLWLQKSVKFTGAGRDSV